MRRAIGEWKRKAAFILRAGMPIPLAFAVAASDLVGDAGTSAASQYPEIWGNYPTRLTEHRWN